VYQSDVYEYLKGVEGEHLFICENDKEAIEVEDVVNFLGVGAFRLPDLRVEEGEDLRPYREEIQQFLWVLSQFYEAKGSKVLIAPFHTLFLPFPKPELFEKVEIAFGEVFSVSQMKEKLYLWGYHFTDMVTQKGEVSFRGDIIDIFPIQASTPYRISLFDEEVESISPYRVDTQKRVSDELESLLLPPAFLALNQEEYEALKRRCEVSAYESFVKDIDALGLWHLGELAQEGTTLAPAKRLGEWRDALEEYYSFATPRLDKSFFLNLSTLPEAKHYRDVVVADMNKLISAHQDKEITIIAKNQTLVRSSTLDSFEGLHFCYQEGVVNIMGENVLILSLNKRQKSKRVKRPSLVLDALKVGDYVVHENHGVGIFKGIEKREVLGATSEFVVIHYQNEDALLIPVTSLESIERYVAEGGALPVLDRMGKASFKKLKAKVKEKLFAIASQIINLSAQRHLHKGILLQTPPEHFSFLHRAGFTHTPDQKRAIEEVLSDLSSGEMMDRLLSADVGFGKTEVAMNAMFVAVKSGYQAMMIAPTTLLSAQHFKSMQERFAKEEIRLAKLDRFCTAKQKRETLEGLKEGRIDLVVGTHALLKAAFKNLALVVIDEEHKFGVKQKEALKEMSVNVHLLSMSATPIPRSLNLALSEVKKFSEILTPPMARQGVRTFVKQYDDKVIKEAILRELRRGGQVFYVFNSIAGIEEKQEVLKHLLPTLRMTVLHSKISAKETEEEMLKFEKGEYDLLLSTSIVESGIHMPHANTMIVDGADRFGMADLHQLRGRVGRGTKEGYCYFMVESKEQLSENAKRRLLALESHSELGSGAVLAFHDLEIRGGGNIIGEAQSGHIKQIGYGLYLRMLEDAILELRGKSKLTSSATDMKLAIDAYLSESVIFEDRLRLELYRRLAHCENVAEVYEIEEEMVDRFGTLDRTTRQYLDVMVMKVLATQQEIVKISSYGQRVFIEFAHSEKEREVLQADSKDDDDIIAVTMQYLKKK